MEPPDKALSAPPTPIAQAALTMYLVEASVRPEILRTGQAVLPLEPSSTHAIGLPGGGSVQMVVTGGRRHGRRAGGGGASAGQGLFPVVDQLPEGQGGYWGSHLTTPQVRPCSLRDTAHPSPGPPPPITLMPHPPLHYQPCPLESLKDPIFRGSLGGPPQHTHTLTGGSRAAPGCICHHPAWRRCAQPQWPGQWPGGHPAPGPVGGRSGLLDLGAR